MTNSAPVLPVLALILCLAAYWLFLWGDLSRRAARRGLIDEASRQAQFAIWCLKALVLFGAVGVLALATIGDARAIVRMPVAFGDARRLAVTWVGDGQGFPIGLLLGAMLAGGIVGELVGWLRRSVKPFMLGDIGILMPRTPGELWWGAAMSVIAGVAEEIFFRLAVPLLVTFLTGSAAAGFGVGLVLFALAHRYQGWLGVAATAVVGALMTALYLMSGALWLAMLIHGFIDLNGLVIRPILRRVLPPRA